MPAPLYNPDRIFPARFDATAPDYPQPNYQAPVRGNVMRRRVVVFFSVFLLCAIGSLSYTFMRPAIYLASARLLITPLAKSPIAEAANSSAGLSPLLLEMQVLDSRPLLEKVVARLAELGEPLSIDTDPVLALQNMLKVSRVEGSNVVQIDAQGPQRMLLPRVINAVLDVYREQQAQTGQSSTQTELRDTREEVRVVEARVAEKRRALEEFRLRANIVSGERDENQTLTRIKGLGASLSAATDREAAAEGKVRALEQVGDDGQRAPVTRESATVTAMEQRLSQAREDWRAMERQFMPQYLDMDPNARALKTRIASLEQQIDNERRNSQRNALVVAREELATAQATTQRLQQKLAEEKPALQTFSRRFGDFQAMQEELRGLDQMRQTVRQRLLALEASEVARKPRMQVLEAAVAPETAGQPLYWRDAGISVVVSLVLGFLAVWFVEFFNRAEPVPPGPSTVIFPQPWVPVPFAGTPQLAGADRSASLPGATQTSLLPAPHARELADEEVRVLLANAAPENLPMLACLLSGLSAAALVGLRISHVDADARKLAVPGESDRSLALEGPLRELAARGAGSDAQTPLFPDAKGEPLTLEDVHAIVASSAYDARLGNAQDISPETLRHTYIAFLVRQGLRFSELGKIVGRVPAGELSALALLAPASARVGMEAVERMLPALREFSANS